MGVHSGTRQYRVPLTASTVPITDSFSRTLQNLLSALTSRIFTCTDHYRLASRALANSTIISEWRCVELFDVKRARYLCLVGTQDVCKPEHLVTEVALRRRRIQDSAHCNQ